jgi:hypothetical protein
MSIPPVAVRLQVDEREPGMRIVASTWKGLCRWSRKLGPYLMIEILLPGGTLVALLLYLHRRGRA